MARAVGVGVVGVALSAPGQTVGVSVFIDRYVEDLGLSSSSVATAYLIGTLGGALAMSRTGTLIDRYGVRRSTIAIGLAFGLAVLSLGSVVNWVTVALAFIGVRMLGQGAVPLVATSWVAKKIGHKQGGAMAFTLGLGQVGLAFIPVVLAAISVRYGWRTAAGAGAVLVWLTLPALAIFGMRDERSISLSSAAASGGESEPEHSVTRPDALRTGIFWLVTITWAIGSMIHTAVAYHHFAIMRESSVTGEVAAAIFVPMQIAMLAGMLSVAWLSSRVGPRLVTPLAMGSLVVALWTLGTASTLPWLIFYAVTVGIGMGMAWAQEATYMPRLFGPAHIGGIRGVSAMVNIGLAAIGPLILARSVEMVGNYRSVLVGFAVVAGVTAVWALIVRTPDELRPLIT